MNEKIIGLSKQNRDIGTILHKLWLFRIRRLRDRGRKMCWKIERKVYVKG